MTTIVAIMNKNGVSLAGDRAGSLNNGSVTKIYDSSKIFRLHKNSLIGLATYDSSHISGIPVEILAKTFRSGFTENKDNLFEYVDAFLIHLNKTSFSIEDATIDFISSIFQLIIKDVKEGLNSISGEIDQTRMTSVFKEIISRYLSIDTSKGIKSNLQTKEISIHIENNKQLIESLIDSTFSVYKNTQEDTNGIVSIIEKFYEFPEMVNGIIRTGLIFTGFGEQDLFPKLKEIRVFTVIGENIVYISGKETTISRDKPYDIQAFAQVDVVTNLIQGINPDMKFNLINGSGLSPKNQIHITSKISTLVQNNVNEFQGIMFLPLYEIGTTAESLVNLTSFKRRVTMSEESVGLGTDVALISKYDKFIWLNRKHYFDKELNPHFFRDYE